LGLLCAGWFALASAADEAASWRGEWPRTDFSQHTVALGAIDSGGPPKDGIPAIDRPRFVLAPDASRWLDPREPVIVLEYRGEARAYPLQILIFHEIVNDDVAGTPVLVTFCPLCNAALIFERRVKGAVLDFGTTGKLRNIDLVMYDRQTESWWQQFTGQAIVGHYAGATLNPLPATIASYADFRAAYPAGRVLSRDTGYARPYGRNPYRGYDRAGDAPFLFHNPVDPRLPAMERVLGVAQAGVVRLYPLEVLKTTPIVNDEIGREPIVVFSRAGLLSALDAERISESREIQAAAAYQRTLEGRVLLFARRDHHIVDNETGSEWDLFGRAIAGPLKGERLKSADSGVHFAFAWLAFNPGSEIYGVPGTAARK
jgi:hypothetical protein